jgi:hypothetical protein
MMADRITYPTLSMDRKLTILTGSVTLGAASIASTDCLGFAVTRTGAGAYRITLEDKWGDNTNAALLFASATFFDDDAEDKDAWFKAPAMSSKQIDFIAYDTSGAAADDPASGVVIRILLVLSNTSAPRKGA